MAGDSPVMQWMGSPKNCFEVVRIEQHSRNAQVSLKEGRKERSIIISKLTTNLTYLFNLNIMVETLVEFFGLTYFLRSAKADMIAILN